MLTVGGKVKKPSKGANHCRSKTTLIGAAAGIMLIVHMQNVGLRTLYVILCVVTASEKRLDSFYHSPIKANVV